MSRFSSAFTSGRRRTPRTRLKMAALAPIPRASVTMTVRSEEHTSELQSRLHLVCRLLLEKKKADHLVELVLADLVADEAERRAVSPFGYIQLARIALPLRPGPEEDVRAAQLDHLEHAQGP